LGGEDDMFVIIVIHFLPLVRLFPFLLVTKPFLFVTTPIGISLPLTLEFLRLPRVTVFGLMTKPIADAALGLAKEPTILSLVVPQTT